MIRKKKVFPPEALLGGKRSPGKGAGLEELAGSLADLPLVSPN